MQQRRFTSNVTVDKKKNKDKHSNVTTLKRMKRIGITKEWEKKMIEIVEDHFSCVWFESYMWPMHNKQSG